MGAALVWPILTISLFPVACQLPNQMFVRLKMYIQYSTYEMRTNPELKIELKLYKFSVHIFRLTTFRKCETRYRKFASRREHKQEGLRVTNYATTIHPSHRESRKEEGGRSA